MTEQSTQLSADGQRIATRAAEDKARHWQGVADAQRREIERLTAYRARIDRQNDEMADEIELLRHQLEEARVGRQAANNAMYHAIRHEREQRESAAYLTEKLADVSHQFLDCQASYALLRERGWLRRLWAAVKGGWR